MSSFFDRVSSTVTGAGTQITQKAKEISEIARLNGEITKAENSRSDVYRTIGESFYNAAKSGAEQGAYTVQIQKVDELTAQIASLKEELRKVKGVTNCPICGAEIDKDAAFCPKCGAKLTNTQQTGEEPTDNHTAE